MVCAKRSYLNHFSKKNTTIVHCQLSTVNSLGRANVGGGAFDAPLSVIAKAVKPPVAIPAIEKRIFP